MDYDGTLAGFNSNPQLAGPDQELLTLLADLSADKRNRVIIVSGRDRATLEKWLGHLPLDFIVEHGVWLRALGEEWTMLRPLTNDWMHEIRPILDLHVSRTAGSFVEEKEYSLVWHYRRADIELGEVRARELTSHLHFLASNSDLQVMEGNKVVEVKSAGVNKGAGAARWLSFYPADFIIAIGDDRTDEDTFGAMPSHAYTVKVGSTHRSLARFHLDTHHDVRRVLRALVEA
ncbi:trehalose-phosphatase [Hymenobacter sp. HDW8]|uniref:trehalose-phosphatase n=1 Tax=Hymenobacter sp. HDW8 TaxID=2714932 RepID=UPI00293BF2C8|nr:trehalose-phosphatase [Hymenobacter sp. HDW8]